MKPLAARGGCVILELSAEAMAEPLDLKTELGASELVSNQRLTLYIPNANREGRILPDHDLWVREARQLLTRIGRGATAFPSADGNWQDDDTGTVIWESTRIVFCFVVPERFRARVKDLREFLHRFGRETGQGEVVVEFDNFFYRIVEFDNP